MEAFFIGLSVQLNMKRNEFITVYRNIDNVIVCTACKGVLEIAILCRGYNCISTPRICCCNSKNGIIKIDKLLYEPFDNTKHIIIADLNKCYNKKYGCLFDCSNCKITIAIELRKEIEENVTNKRRSPQQNS